MKWAAARACTSAATRACSSNIWARSDARSSTSTISHQMFLEHLGTLGCEIVDLDYLAPMGQGRAKMGPNQILLGNMNPVSVLRNGTPGQVNQVVEQCHREAGPRFIVAAGCEVPRD